MKTYRKLLLILTFIICSTALFAQGNHSQIDSLLKQGVTLNDAGKFAEAIAKYDEALKIDPNNLTAQYEKGFSLQASGKVDDAIPYFEKVVAAGHMPNAYVALANIYDNRGDYEKAEKYYMQGVASYPNYGSLWYNLGLLYMHQKKYAQAQSAAMTSIKLNNKHVASYQIYGFAAYLQGKNAEALLGISNFLMYNPPPQQAKVAAVIVKGILIVQPAATTDPLAKLEQETITKAVASATAGKNNLSATDSLSLQLTAAFKVIKDHEDQFNSPFFSKYFGNFFGDLANTNYMDVFTRVISVSLSPQENLAWLKSHPDDTKGINVWLAGQKRVAD